MKRQIRVGEGYALTKYKLKQFNIRYSSLLAVLMSMCLYAVKQVSAQQAEPAATAATAVKPLQIGDTIPDLPISLFSPERGVRDATVNSVAKGKWIVLEFWNTMCGVCIASMPHLFDLQTLLSENLAVIPVSHEPVDQISEFFRKTRSPYIDKVRDRFITVTGDTTLASLFAIKSTPITVIVDDRRVVQVITRPQALDEENVAALLTSGAEVANISPLVTDFKRSLPNQKKDIQEEEKLYSVISGYNAGAAHQMAWKTDSVNDCGLYLVSNASIPKLYTLALNSPLPINKKRIIMEIGLSRIHNQIMVEADGPSTHRPDLFCYEIRFPGELQQDEVLGKMKSDLDFFFQLNGRIEPRNVRCLALQITDRPTTFRSVGNTKLKVVNGLVNSRFVEEIREVGALSNGADTYIRYGNFNDVTALIDEISNEPLPLIFNETGYEGRFDLSFPSPKEATLETINRSLNAQGLELCWVEREIDMFILSENGFDQSSGALQLTDVGYIYSSTLNQ